MGCTFREEPSRLRGLQTEHEITLAEVTKLIAARIGKKPHTITVTRWVLAGVLLPDGSRLKLEAHKFFGRWISSIQAVDRFLAARDGVCEQEVSHAK